MIDEFDWGYHETSKEEQLTKFEEELGSVRFKPEREGTGYGWVIYDLDKTWPDYDPYYDVIAKYCDVAYYWTDSSRTSLKKMERIHPLPPKTWDEQLGKAKFTIEDLDKKLSEISNRH